MTTFTFADFESILASHIAPDDWQKIRHLPITGICSDSRAVKNGEIFTLLSVNPDIKAKAKAFITPLSSAAVLSEFSKAEMDIDDAPMPIVYIPNLRLVLGDFIAAFLQKQQEICLPKIVAVTGTNGKTTISQLIAQLGELSNTPSAIMGTAGNGRIGNLTQSTHTTSEVIKVHEFLYAMAKQHVGMVALEASSHGLHQHRLQGVPVQVAIFSNLSRDHLDYHTDMDCYAAAKAKLFDNTYFTHLHHAIINIDDTFGQKMAENLSHSAMTVWTYSLKDSQADFFAQNITPSLDGTTFELKTPFDANPIKLHSPLLGRFNVANLLASIAGFLAIYPNKFQELPDIIRQLHGARGRMQKVATPANFGCFIVDYAHTPDALVQVLTSLKAHCTGNLWAVFGCGGDRDKGKRPQMTKAGLDYADQVILTADNPRSENVLAILNDMQVGMTCDDHYKTQIIPDRKEAILYAIKHAKADDIVLIAGKGHETYQEINGVRYDFDDVKIIQQYAQTN